MAELKFVVSDPKTGKAYNVDVTGGSAGVFIGKRIGDEVDAGPLGLSGYKIQITGGSDRTGTPANSTLPGAGKKKLLASAGMVGYHPKMEGQRRRKTLRAKEITADFVQVNAKVTIYGEKSLTEIFPAKPDGEKKPGTEKPAEKKPVAEKSEEKKPAAEKPAEKKPVTEKPEEKKPAAEKPADKKPEEKAPEKKAAEKTV